MYKHIAESFIAVAHTQCVTETICVKVQDFCRSIVSTGPDRLLDFGGGRMIIRALDEGLFLNVSAGDLVTFYGIRTLVEGSLVKDLSCGERGLEWLPADKLPFLKINLVQRRMWNR
ncbi:hypothetical protein [Agrobacterium sp. T29]|uniref:SMa0974 family conjugal transfer regulator n=1 Tax=Agrobacterium sp. T29 TaxID=2580515 RepID=UPI00115ED296|nr:hypothetical protein [Agrobacterium sp. T29]